MTPKSVAVLVLLLFLASAVWTTYELTEVFSVGRAARAALVWVAVLLYGWILWRKEYERRED